LTNTLPPSPALSVDAVLFDQQGRLLLIRRKYPPFQGQYALPGGFVDYGETVETAVQRELEEETGVRTGITRLVGVYSAPDRDPRRHNVSVAFLMQPSPQQPVGGDDAASAAYVDDWKDVELAFDHRRIVDDACNILKAK
jgi:8-oxo-dGTP diphosphatase